MKRTVLLGLLLPLFITSCSPKAENVEAPLQQDSLKIAKDSVKIEETEEEKEEVVQEVEPIVLDTIPFKYINDAYILDTVNSVLFDKRKDFLNYKSYGNNHSFEENDYYLKLYKNVVYLSTEANIYMFINGKLEKFTPKEYYYKEKTNFSNQNYSVKIVKKILNEESNDYGYYEDLEVSMEVVRLEDNYTQVFKLYGNVFGH